MRFRLKAFALHLLASAFILGSILAGLYAGWYHWPGWFLTSVLHVTGILLLVDVVVGPTVTLIIANPRKPRRELARDISLIAIVQLVALAYGTSTLWRGRPLYYTYSGDRLETVTASDLGAKEIALAQSTNPTFAPHWNSLPRWVWAPLPDDPKTAEEIVNSSIFGGPGHDVIDMPRYFKPWNSGLPELRRNLEVITSIKQLSKAQQRSVSARMRSRGLSPTERNALVFWGVNSEKLVAVFDPATLTIRAFLKPD
jgi:hypothetical protein